MSPSQTPYRPRKDSLADSIHAAARSRLRNARNYQDDDLVANWERAYAYYKGEAPGPTDAQDSTVVSTDVSDTVEWVLPAVLKPLIESPDVVRFDPVSPEDVEQAALESDYVHTVFMKRCRGFEKLYVHTKDALLLKIGVFCTYWDEGVRHQKETYRDLTDVELADLMNPADGSKVKLLEQQVRKVPLIDVRTGTALPPPAQQDGAQAPPPPPPTEVRYDVSVRRFWPRGKAIVENCAPEAFGVDMGHNSISLEDARFCWYTMNKSRSELVALGYSEDDIDECPPGTSDTFDNETKYAREDVERTANTWADENDTGDPSQDMYEVHRVYLRYDGDGDGLDEQYLVVLGGRQGEVMFDFYEVPENPFSASTPFIAGHKFYGYSLFDKLRELADHKTKVLRMLEDNIDLSNNPRIKGVRGAFVLEDVLMRRVGGLWRVDSPDAVQEIPPIGVQQQAQQLLDYYDKMRAERSGVDPHAQSLASLPEESMNAAVERVMSAKEELVGMLIRTFAETGIKDMFQKLRGVLMRNMDKDEMVQLRNKWVTVNPASWIERTDSTIVVGLGTGDKMRKAAGLSQVLDIQMQAMQGGLQGILVSPQRMAHTVKELVRMQGLGDPDDFVLDPNLLLDPRNFNTPRGQEIVMAQQLQQQMAQQQAQMEQAKQQALMESQQALLNSQKEVAQIKAEADVIRTQMQEQSRSQQQLAKVVADLEKFQAEMRLRWAELAASETAAEDRLVVEHSKVQAGLAQKQVEREEKAKDRELSREQTLVGEMSKERERAMAPPKPGETK